MLSAAAPEQRPPDPIMPILIVPSPAACTLRLRAKVPKAAPEARIAESWRNRRRVVWSGLLDFSCVDMLNPSLDGWGVGRCAEHRVSSSDKRSVHWFPGYRRRTTAVNHGELDRHKAVTAEPTCGPRGRYLAWAHVHQAKLIECLQTTNQTETASVSCQSLPRRGERYSRQQPSSITMTTTNTPDTTLWRNLPPASTRLAAIVLAVLSTTRTFSAETAEVHSARWIPVLRRHRGQPVRDRHQLE